MWLTTTQGFYSAVAHRNKPGHVLVRARVKDDLRALKKQLPKAKIPSRIFSDMRADYPWRLVLSAEEWAEAMAKLAADVDYDNFKNAVKDRQGVKRANVYMGVWSQMLKLEGGGHWARWQKAAPLPLPSASPLDWRCEECGEECFDSEHQCPFCRTPRPEVDRDDTLTTYDYQPLLPGLSESRSVKRSRGKSKKGRGKARR